MNKKLSDVEIKKQIEFLEEDNRKKEVAAQVMREAIEVAQSPEFLQDKTVSSFMKEFEKDIANKNKNVYLNANQPTIRTFKENRLNNFESHIKHIFEIAEKSDNFPINQKLATMTPELIIPKTIGVPQGRIKNIHPQNLPLVKFLLSAKDVYRDVRYGASSVIDFSHPAFIECICVHYESEEAYVKQDCSPFFTFTGNLLPTLGVEEWVIPTKRPIIIPFYFLLAFINVGNAPSVGVLRKLRVRDKTMDEAKQTIQKIAGTQLEGVTQCVEEWEEPIYLTMFKRMSSIKPILNMLKSY